MLNLWITYHFAPSISTRLSIDMCLCLTLDPQFYSFSRKDSPNWYKHLSLQKYQGMMLSMHEPKLAGQVGIQILHDSQYHPLLRTSDNNYHVAYGGVSDSPSLLNTMRSFAKLNVSFSWKSSKHELAVLLYWVQTSRPQDHDIGDSLQPNIKISRCTVHSLCSPSYIYLPYVIDLWPYSELGRHPPVQPTALVIQHYIFWDCHGYGQTQSFVGASLGRLV